MGCVGTEIIVVMSIPREIIFRHHQGEHARASKRKKIANMVIGVVSNMAKMTLGLTKTVNA